MSPEPFEPGWGLWMHGVRPVPELVELAGRAEELGASVLLLADEGTDRDIYVTLTAIAAATSRLTLVPGITNPHSRHPVATAAAFASLAEVAPGRVVVGLGAGGHLVFDPLGLDPARPYTALAEAVDVIDDLLAGKTVEHHGEFTVDGAALPWSAGRLPIAIAGRGPRVQRLAARRGDWFLIAGKPVEHLAAATGQLRRERPVGVDRPVIAWNPAVGWAPEHVEEIRGHFSYMAVDAPPGERRALGVSDELAARIRTTVHQDGPRAAASLVPEAFLEAYAIVGDGDAVTARLRQVVAAARPDLVVFPVHEYTTGFVAAAAAIAAAAGLSPAAVL